MDLYRLLVALYPYPAPRAPVKALLEFFEGTLKDTFEGKLLKDVASIDKGKFQIVGILKCDKGHCHCICGRPIVHVFQISHLDYAISFGLGRECVKRFFPELSLRDMLAHQRRLDKLTLETEASLNAGLTSDHPVFLEAAQYRLLTVDQVRRLELGLPLTLKEHETLRVQLTSRHSALKRQKQAVARKALALSGQKPSPEAFKFLLAKLESGGEIKTLEALQQIDITDLAKSLPSMIHVYIEDVNRMDQLVDTSMSGACEAMHLSAEQYERGRVMLSIVSFLATQQEQLTPVAQQRLQAIEASLMGLSEPCCYRRLLEREVQQELVNMGNQLGINLTIAR